MANTPELTLFGLVLEDANPAERATLLSALPAPVRDIWHVIGRPRYARPAARLIRSVQGGPARTPAGPPWRVPVYACQRPPGRPRQTIFFQ
ncbi:hypothetical protein ACFWIB_39540 [Streptomyces sp. NPDC127051]|uniref:hypothetical protein n=1 Tax=Streptomyces sp. NPDC127051 TaxID=3347119 RepID=UPI0036617BFE